ncbi:aspartate--tRNA(Asn) ligase [Breznakiella homolactica]|uniref:Aspartate--tRNA(Asp/Asn) ligase n=1 Tax=Breznakiella homolactica TaxID=2798577 RepID=A0A7T8BD55_9SPIR|nr:aspartate--tRNA(Asn) ligase [Breznakiella homolactica]QQO10908.1 aspartate--tRNA(Asn) ligase [Breznakiella homolactica]
MRTLAKDIRPAAERSGDTVEVYGWVHRIRELGGIVFIVLRDRSGLVQLVLEEKPDLTLESVIRVSGIPAVNPKAPGGAEIRVLEYECISRASGDLPYQVNGDVSKTGLETILDHRPLSLRNPKIRAVFAVQSAIIEAFSGYLRDHDFTEIKTSKLIGGGTEGGTGLFTVDYFGRKVYLAQSPQFYKQTMVAAGFERVFEVAPAYRAEKHDTPRHLNEYVSMDVEMGFIESEKDLIELEKGLLAYIFDALNRKNSVDLALWDAPPLDPGSVSRAPTVPYDEALRIAASRGGPGGQAPEKMFDLNPEAERLLCDWAQDEYGIGLVFVNEFPRRSRPFYTYPLDEGRTMSFDALFRGLEITTGGRRQENYQAILEVLPKFGLTSEGLEDYLAIFKYGCPPHGGFAIGCERLTQKILGLASVKEASLFPRDRKRTAP